MGTPLPGRSRYLYSPGHAHAVRRPAPRASWWTYGVLVVAAVYLAVVARASGSAIAALPWVIAPLLAALAWGRAAQRSPAAAGAAFRVLGAAPVIALFGVLLWLYEAVALVAGEVPVAMYVLLLPYLAMAGGAALALWARKDRSWQPSLAADAALLFLAAAAAMLRLVVEPMLATGGGRTMAVLAALQSLALVPILVAALLVLDRGPVLSPRSAVLLLVATLVFGTGTVASLAGLDPEPLRLGDGFDYIWAAGWLVFALSGVRAREDASTEQAMMALRRTRDTLRKLIVPGAALFMAVAVTDIGLGVPARPVTVGAIALFGVVLAIRTAHALRMADRDAEQRRQLAHTRALVEVTHSLAGTTDLDRTLETISESARTVFGTRAAGIELVSEDGESLEIRSALGLPERALGLRFPVAGSFTGWVVRHGRPRASVDPSRDPYIQPKSLDLLGTWPIAAAPIRFQGETLGALFACIREDPFDAEELELLHAMAEQAAIAIQNARLFEQVSEMSVTDPLTGLANRRQLQQQLNREIAAAGRGRDLAAVIFDLDDFKLYNDANGHLAGDEALQAFGAALRAETRAMNLAARYGGDEFVVLMANARAEGARTYIRRVRERFAEAVEQLGRGSIHVSAGMAVYHPDMADDPEALLREADADLYRSKPRTRM